MRVFICSVKITGALFALFISFLSHSAAVPTPNGTLVNVVERLPMSAAQVAQANASFLAQWPEATLVEDATTVYNCHSFAFYWFNPANPYWMNDPSAYWEDGSWSAASGIAYRDNLEYYVNGELLHSGPAYSYSNGLLGVLSKWGSWPLAYHHYLYTPYSLATSSSASTVTGLSIAVVRKN